jgi:glycosyltransferase involved in cell wall biosynthesis
MGWTLWDGLGRTPHGAAVVTYELTRRLTRYFDCDMIFWTSDKEKAGRTEDTPGGFRRRFVHRRGEPWLLDEDLIREYDLIHIWGPQPIFAYRAFTSSLLPHCYTLHSAASMMDWIGLASAFYIPGFDAVTLGSRCLVEALRRFWDVPVNVIPYGVDTEFYRPMDRDECRERLGIPKDTVVLGYLGRVSKLDVSLAYDAVRETKRRLRGKDIIFIAAGGARRIKPIQVKEDFIYLGYLERDELPVFLNSCDVFFNPTAGVREGFGLTVVEAMSCGLPIITAHWDGYSETVTPEVGFLARTCWMDGDVWINQEDLVSACVELIRDEDLRENMSMEARRRAVSQYRWDRCVERYRDLFLELMRKAPPENFVEKLRSGRVTIRTRRQRLSLPLREALRSPEAFRADFEDLYRGFVSDSRAEGRGWRRVNCVDNILNLPRYRTNMRGALEDLGSKIASRFPVLVEALRGT